MNTGVQTSTATPYGAITTTNPAGKKTVAKDLIGIIAAHNSPYVATASLAFLDDFRDKIKKARDTKGFRLIMVDGPCPPGQKYPPELSIELSRMAVNSKLFPLYEIADGKYTITYSPKKEIPVEECLKLQGRFSHLFKNGSQSILNDIQQQTNANWKKLLKQEEWSNE